MAEHMQEWLNAYLDGELSGRRRELVEQHLAACPGCRAEFEALRRLSQVVQQVPMPQEFLSTERFTAQVLLRLPRQPLRAARRSRNELGWWLVPAVLLAGWAFVQAVLWLNSGIWAAGQTGLLSETAAWLAPAPQGSGMITGILAWLGALPGENAGQVAAFSERIGWNLLVQLLLEGGLAVLYLGWLATWWLHRQQQSPSFAPAMNQNISR